MLAELLRDRLGLALGLPLFPKEADADRVAIEGVADSERRSVAEPP